MAIQQNLRDQTLTKIKEVVNNNKVSKSSSTNINIM